MQTIPVPPHVLPMSGAVPRALPEGPLWDAAQKLEATFLAEMLKSTGLGAMPESFGGGVGEEQFGSYLRQAQAKIMVQGGGIGLAESLFEAMKVRFDA